ncbi:MAG: cytochrome c peroxidase [Cyclobacteriaceae bacterium]
MTLRKTLVLFVWGGLSSLGNSSSLDGCDQIIQPMPSVIGESVSFDLFCSSQEDKLVTWSFGDGSVLVELSGNPVQHVYNKTGVFSVFARFDDGSSPIFVNHTVSRPPTPIAPTKSGTIVFNSDNNRVWCVNPDNNTVAQVDGVSLDKVLEVPVGKHPRTLALDKDGNVWVANQGDATISIISPEGQQIGLVNLPYASRPYGICATPSAEIMLVTLQGTGRLLKISVPDRSISGNIDVGPSPRGIVVTHDQQFAYVSRFISSQMSGEIRKVNIQSMSILKIIPLQIDDTPDFDDNGRGIPNFVSSMTISPDGSELWIPSKKDNIMRGVFRDGLALNFDNTVRTITLVINLNTEEEDYTKRIDYNDTDLNCAAEFSPYGNLLFVASQGNNKIEVVDAYTGARVGRIDETGLAPQGLVFNNDGSKLFIQNFTSRSISVFDTRDIILSNSFERIQLSEISTVTSERLPPEILLGKQIFYNAQDKRMSRSGYISCASCHLGGESDERVWDFTDRGEGFRNTHSLLGRGGVSMGNVHWTGNFDEIQDFENDIRNGFGGSGFLSDEDFNTGTRSNPLGDLKAGLSEELDALSAYVTSLDKVLPSPYRNSDGSLTQDGVKGKALFAKLRCDDCHSGENFTDKLDLILHDVGTIKESSGQRIGEQLTGFVTPPLKGIWHTAPYLHDGSAETLREVFTKQNPDDKHGKTSGLADHELDELVSYLNQIDAFEEQTPTLSQVDVDKSGGDILIYPNPARKGSRVRLMSDSKSPWRLMNISGRLIKRGQDAFIETKDLEPGVYLVRYGAEVIKMVIN